MLIIYPPAIAGGTDCIQQWSLTFEVKLERLDEFIEFGKCGALDGFGFQNPGANI